MSALPAIKLEWTQSLRAQITEQVRRQIRSGQWPAGQRLPAASALAAAWGTDPTTVHRALTTLVTEGLLDRTPRRGTFVRRRAPKLTCVGVFNGVAVHESLYLQALHQALQAEFQRAGLEMDVWLDPRPEAEFAEPWWPFLHAADHREFQAVIVTTTSHLHLQWQTKLSLPTVFHAEQEDLPNRVGWDMDQFAELSVQALVQQGCRSIGLISPVLRSTNGWVERLVQLSQRRGLRVHESWVRMPNSPVHRKTHQEQFGHEQFLRLWSQRQRPDGLVVYPDSAARGVILGLLEQQVRVPGELKLAFHKNEAVDLYCPLPVTFVVGSERAVARALIAQAQKQFRGEPCQPISIGFTVSRTPNDQPTTTGGSSSR